MSIAVFVVAVACAGVLVVRTVASMARASESWATGRRAVLIVLLVAVPVVFDPGTAEVFNLTKFTLLTLACLVVALLWSAELAFTDRPLRWSGLHWAVAALVAWTAACTAMSVSPRLSVLGAYASYDGLYAAAAFALLFAAVADAFSIAHVRAVLTVLFLGGGGLCVLYGAFQLHDRYWRGSRWDWVGWAESVTFSKDREIWSSFGNPNHFAGFLAILLPIGLVLLLLHRASWMRAPVGAVLVALVAEIGLIYSNGAALAAIVGVAVLVLMLWRALWRNRVATAASLVACCIALVVASLLISSVGDASTGSQRIELWKTAVRIANHRPLAGTGPDGYPLLYPAFKTRELSERYGATAGVNGPHNLFLNQLATQGYPGLLALLVVLALAGRRALGTWRRLLRTGRGEGDAPHEHDDARLVLAGVTAGIAAYIVTSCFDVAQIGLTFSFWFLLGLLVVVTGDPGRERSFRTGLPPLEPTDSHRTAPEKTRRTPSTAGRLVAAVAVLLVVAGLVPVAGGPYLADRRFHAAVLAVTKMQTLGPDGSDQADDLVATARQELGGAIGLNPWEASYRAVLAGSLVDSARRLPGRSPERLSGLRDGGAMYEEAVRLAPWDSELLERYAVVLQEIHQVDPADGSSRVEAADVLRRAIRANPFEMRLEAELRKVLAS